MINRDSAALTLRKRASIPSKHMGTFAPAYLKSAVDRKVDPIAEAAFGEKKWVWVRDSRAGFLKAWVTREDDETLYVRCTDETDKVVKIGETDKVNPPKFDGVQDMASLTYLNEPSVAHNLQQRYEYDSIYTYSGLFLVAVNPYRSLPIYNRDTIDYFKNRVRDELGKPHVFGTSDLAFRNMLEMRENQSILVTGESGAGKTENTKKVIQYLAAIASKPKSAGSSDVSGDLEQQIIQANPILEAFGNAQTVRNDNSSRFGKFIRIQFNEQGQITGAHIDWFLLEKSRVVKQTSKERNYHIFYQLLAGASKDMRAQLLLDGTYRDYAYLKDSRGVLPGVSDQDMFEELIKSFNVMKFSQEEQMRFFRVIAAILLIGNIEVTADRADQARLPDLKQVEKVCHLLGIQVKDFTKALLTPRVKAGREWVTSARNATQVKSSLAALSRSLYERNFGALVERINQSTERTGTNSSSFIGVLDMAGFEIFQKNSFEQLCINYTNEKLQQFFNHHMFVLEQEEYARERIEWKFIDFGLDLQPTIELIEKSSPIGILSCLDEESVMPKATDETFTEKLHHLWKDQSSKYRTAKFPKDGFVLTHYAADVEYTTDGWLEKNKDPLNENVNQLLAQSNVRHISHLFIESDTEDGSRIKKGLFRTVAQKHKEQLSSLMHQLNTTQPHFIRCIIPNHEKTPRKFDFALVLDQLRCNGVLEGIRIARTGFPNRLLFSEFRQRYAILASALPKGYLEGQEATQLILEAIGMDAAYFRIGLSKVFFRAGVLAELEERRETMFRTLIMRIQSVAQGYLTRRITHKRLHRKDATKLLKNDFKNYLTIAKSPWWQLFMRMKPVLSATKSDREMKLRSAEIMKLEALAKSRDQASQRAIEDMHKAEAARQQLEEKLVAERNTASDKENLYARSRERESLLREDLDLALADVDTLESRCDELLQTKKELEAQIDTLRLNVDQGTLIAERIQAEKTDLKNRLDAIESSVDGSSQKVSELEALKLANEVLLNQLQQKLRSNEKELKQVREAHDSKRDELDKIGNLSKSQTEKLQSQLEKALLEKKASRSQLDEMISSTSMSELLIRKKDSELTDLKNKLAKYESQDSELESINSNQHVELQSLKAQISVMELESASARQAKDRLEEELSALRAGKSSSEAVSALEVQIDALRQELEVIQGIRAKDSAQHRLTLETKNREAETHRLAVQRLEVINGDLVKQIAKAMQENLELKKEIKVVAELRATLSSQREEYRTRLARAEMSSDSVDTIRVGLQKQLVDAQERAKAALARASQVDVEKERFRREALDMKAKFDDLTLQKNSGEGTSKKHEGELAAAQLKLKVLVSDYEAVKQELHKSKAKLDHVNRLDEDLVATQVRDVTKQKVMIEGHLQTARAEKARVEKELLELKTSKSRFTKELEDLNHELDKEHQIAMAAEKTTNQIQRSLAESRSNLELEIQQKQSAQTTVRRLQASLDAATEDLTERTEQVLALYRAIADDDTITNIDEWKQKKSTVSEAVNLARELNEARQALKRAEANKSILETQLAETKQRSRELHDFDSRHSMYKKRTDSISTLDIGNRPHSPTRPVTAPWTPPQTVRTTFGEPGRSRTNTLAQNFEIRPLLSSPEPGKADNSGRKIQALQREIEQLQFKLSRSSTANGTAESGPEDSDRSEANLISRLTRENKRLHEMLDDNADQVDAMETAQRRDRASLRDMQNKSMSEIESTFQTLADEKIALTRAQRVSLVELESARSEMEKLKQAKASLQQNLRELQERLEGQIGDRSQDSALVSQLEDDLGDAQMKLEAEAIRTQELDESVKVYRQRAEEYFDRLEQAESTVIRATHAETWAKKQLQEAEDALSSALRDRQNQDSYINKMQAQVQDLEAKLEDGQLEMNSIAMQRSRLQQELEQYRNSKNQELEERDQGAEQTRKAYQRELVSLSSELDSERTNAIKLRDENRIIRGTIEDLRIKSTEDSLNSATWEKEASRKDNKIQDLMQDLQSSESAQRESQSRIVTMLSEIRELRVSQDELSSEKEALFKEKKMLESKYRVLSQSIGERAASHTRIPSSPREDLANTLAEKEELLQVMSEKVSLADATAASAQRDVLLERDANVHLHKQKAALENEKKELQLKIVDLETKSYSNSSKDVKFLQTRILELEKELNGQDRAKIEETRSLRNTDRTIKDLEAALTQRDLGHQRLEDKVAKSDARARAMQADLEALRDADAAHQLRARRAERDASDQRERALRAEKELERYKSREELNKISRSNTMNRLSGTLGTMRSQNSVSVRSSPYSPVR